MTILSLDSSAVLSEIDSMVSSNGKLTPQNLAQLWCVPKINLRKRPCTSKITKLESVNSAFLSGLFADVAKATEETSGDASHHSKKMRTSKNKAFHRCDRSFAVLMKALNQACDKHPTNESFANANTAKIVDVNSTISNVSKVRRDNSLLNQLDYEEGTSTSSQSADVSSTTNVTFPLLPATVSNSSYGNNMNINGRNHPISSPITTLTHVISDLQSSNTEKSSQTLTNDTYGWFVEMEEESSSPANTLLSYTNYLPVNDPYFAPKDLAFSAQVAPKAENYDAELEWATAADTVDDVLGCFF
jgi:hypothetical protein